jgi:type I restriction enzyme S subunit
MPLPPYSEQQRIVKRVDEIFSLIDALEKKYRTEETERSKLVKSSLRVLSQEGSKLALDNLTGIIKTKADAAELRKAILQLAVSGKLVPQDPKEGTGGELLKQIQTENSKFNQKKQKQLSEITDEELPFSIPRSWKWVRIGKLSDIFNGNSISKSEKALKYENVTDGYPYLGTKDIGYGFQKIDYENGVCIPFNELKFKVIAAGTVLICSEGGSAGKKCGIVDREVCFGNKMYAFKAYGDIVLPEFILYNYLTDKFFSQFKNKMTGIIGGISSTKFKELLIPLPPLSEQKRIIQKTSELLSLIEELEISLE